MSECTNSDFSLRINELAAIRQRNNNIRWLLCDYLNNTPTSIHKELVKSIDSSGIIPEEAIYYSLLTGFLGLDPQTSDEDNVLLNNYLRLAVHQLDTQRYTDNPYYHDIQIPEVTTSHWQLTFEKYVPYEAFICNDLLLKEDFREIPQVGFFSETFRFPAVMQKETEWMAIKPNEIETMQPIVDCVKGNVITFGLGLGYFAYMASLKQEVTGITIVERDTEVIELFQRYILPQFTHKQKICIVISDAFEYIEHTLPEQRFDFAFVDLWHDVSDGTDIYLKIKKAEHLSPQTRFLYWIEESLLSAIRWELFESVTQNARSYDEVVECLSDPFVRKIAASNIKLIYQNS